MYAEKQNYPFLSEPVNITQQKWDDNIEPLLSIDCKAYMHENFISDAIEGFLKQQTTFRVQIVVHDDASTDKTQEIIKSYADKYPGLFKITFQIENQYKKNPKTDKYIKPPVITSRYIAKCEGDDYWTDATKLQKQVTFLEDHPDFVATYHDAIVINDKDEILSDSRLSSDGISYKKFDNPEELLKDFNAYELMTGARMLLVTICYRNVIKKMPEESTRSYTGDSFLFLVLGEYGCSKYMGNEIAPAVYRRHTGGVSFGLLNQNFIEDQYAWRLRGFNSLVEMFLYHSRTKNHDIAINYLFEVVYPRMGVLRVKNNPVITAQHIINSYTYKIGLIITYLPLKLLKFYKNKKFNILNSIKRFKKNRADKRINNYYNKMKFKKAINGLINTLKNADVLFYNNYLKEIESSFLLLQENDKGNMIWNKTQSQKDHISKKCIELLKNTSNSKVCLKLYKKLCRKHISNRTVRKIWLNNFLILTDIISSTNTNLKNNINYKELNKKYKPYRKKIILTGLPKAGTDTLYSYLKESPSILMTKEKFHIFDGDFGLKSILSSESNIIDKSNLIDFFFMHLFGCYPYQSSNQYVSVLQARTRLKGTTSLKCSETIRDFLMMMLYYKNENLTNQIRANITEIVFNFITLKKEYELSKKNKKKIKKLKKKGNSKTHNSTGKIDTKKFAYLTKLMNKNECDYNGYNQENVLANDNENDNKNENDNFEFNETDDNESMYYDAKPDLTPNDFIPHFIFDRCIDTESVDMVNYFHNTTAYCFVRDPRSNYIALNQLPHENELHEVNNFMNKYKSCRNIIKNSIKNDNELKCKTIEIQFERFLLDGQYRSDTINSLELDHIKNSHYRRFKPFNYLNDTFLHQTFYDLPEIKMIKNELNEYCLDNEDLRSYFMLNK
jgi:glycosyltransferase involved in cell wall biosynthesis